MSAREGGLVDDDGIDGPFDRAMARAMRDDAKVLHMDRRPVRANGECKWCGRKLEAGETYYHRECSLAAEGKL